MTTTPPSRDLRLPRRMRLSGARQFLAVLRSKVFRHAGPLVVYITPNRLDYNRLGLTVSRRVGKAAQRNRIKRLVREAFRLHQHDLPKPYDVVVRVKPHDPQDLQTYTELLTECIRQLDQRWKSAPQREPSADD